MGSIRRNSGFPTIKSVRGKKIAEIMLNDVIKRALEKEIRLEITENFKDRLVKVGFNPSFGARPLRRAIIQLVEYSMAERILRGEIKEGDVVILDVNSNGEITLLNGEKSFVPKISNHIVGIA